MIKIVAKNVNKTEFKLVLEPRSGFKGVKSREFDLIYGHKCPVCNNIIQAFFKTEQPVNLWPYEETVVLSQGEKNGGEILKVYPDDKCRYGDTLYRSVFNPIDGGSQKIVLKNHILNHRVIFDRAGKADGSGIWEVGDRCCFKTGVFALKENLLVKDLLMFSGMNEWEIPNYIIPDLQACMSTEGLSGYEASLSNNLFRLSEVYGNVLPVVLVERDAVIEGYSQAIKPMIGKYHKANLKK